MSRRLSFALLIACLAGTAGAARAQTAARTVTFRFVPTARAQIAAWIESADGTRFATVGLTQAVALRGIGNRPGASQMNSGYHWPYGRREGVLPVWAHRRAAVPGSVPFPRVIFQNRPEGFASRTCEDSTRDSYFCLSFSVETTRRDTLDAVTCASVFNSDKGRFITPSDVANGYGEPFVEAGVETMRALDASSLYPPRRDFVSCASPSTVNVCMGGGDSCQDHRDSGLYANMARAAMPDIDAVTMATPPGDQPAAISLEIPAGWPDGDYVALLEINTEGDYNASYNDTIYPTPMSSRWDSWAMSYGYPFRGQPSVVFELAIQIRDGAPPSWFTLNAAGYGSLSGVGTQGGALTPIDATISNNAATAPGSGVDRLRVSPGGYRLLVEVASPTDAGTRPDAATDAATTDAAGDAPTGDDAANDAPVERDAGDSGRPPPLCIPGATVACACVGGGAGAQTCGSDGNHFDACQCPPTLAPRNEGCGCNCDVGGSAGGPLGIALLALTLVARPRRRRRRPS